MLPYHHLSHGEEPVSNFDSTFRRAMKNAVRHANAIGNRIRNITLRESMRTSTEWEENMLLFLETESERRKLEEDRNLASQDLHGFLQNSDVIESIRHNKLDLERTRLAVPPIPEHLRDLGTGELSAFYNEYEFDSYDENRPRGSPLPFVYEEPESESEPELEKEEEGEEEGIDVQPTRSDISPLVGFPQPSPIPSPARCRNESESTFDWKDEDESPLLSPETEKSHNAAEQLADELFGSQEDLDKSEPFPFEQISAAARKQHKLLQEPRTTESIGSSAESSSTAESTPQPAERSETRSPSPRPSTSSEAFEDQVPNSIELPHHMSVAMNRYLTSDDGSPEIADEYSMSPPRQVISEPVKTAVEEIPPIPLPVPIHMIKLEKDDSASKLKLRVPKNIFQKGIGMAASEEEDDDDIEEIPVNKKESLKLKFNFKPSKAEVGSPDRNTSERNSRANTVTPVSVHLSGSTNKNDTSLTDSTETKKNVQIPVDAITVSSMEKNALKTSDTTSSKTPIFKTPLNTPLKSADSRKRRSDKIDNSPQNNKKVKNDPLSSSFVTPKNGLIMHTDTPIPRFLRTMTDGRRIVMKIGKIPDNINHFVTPRRDSKGNLHKDLSPTRNTRLKMRFYKKNGELAVEVTERVPDSSTDDHKLKDTDFPIANGPCSSSSIVETPTLPTSISAKGRLAPASRKPSTDTAGKEKKNSGTKNKIAFSNRFNPFANVPSSSKPSTSANAFVIAGTSPSVSSKLPKISPLPKPSATVPMVPPTHLGVSTPKELHQLISQSGPSINLIRTTPIVPKITVVNAACAPEKVSESKDVEKKDISSLLPWMFNTANSSEQKKKLMKPQSTSALNTSNGTSTDLLKVKIEPSDEAAALAQPESPRASSSLSMSFFEDDRGSGFPFLRSPKRTNEPLPVVEFSDDEEDDIAHSTFSHATDHLLGTSKMNKPVNGATPFLPWSTDP
uniref:GLTSCR1 domain-containing protein n=1 Tax=Caenorhabditis tropicalis TaxID=1561998 RepID=A0A1I7T533_9PELO